MFSELFHFLFEKNYNENNRNSKTSHIRTDSNATNKHHVHSDNVMTKLGHFFPSISTSTHTHNNATFTDRCIGNNAFYYCRNINLVATRSHCAPSTRAKTQQPPDPTDHCDPHLSLKSFSNKEKNNAYKINKLSEGPFDALLPACTLLDAIFVWELLKMAIKIRSF